MLGKGLAPAKHGSLVLPPNAERPLLSVLPRSASGLRLNLLRDVLVLKNGGKEEKPRTTKIYFLLF